MWYSLLAGSWVLMLFEGCWQGINPQYVSEDPSILYPTYSSAHRCYAMLCNELDLVCQLKTEGWVVVIICFGGQWLSLCRASPWCNAHMFAVMQWKHSGAQWRNRTHSILLSCPATFLLGCLWGEWFQSYPPVWQSVHSSLPCDQRKLVPDEGLRWVPLTEEETEEITDVEKRSPFPDIQEKKVKIMIMMIICFIDI